MTKLLLSSAALLALTAGALAADLPARMVVPPPPPTPVAPLFTWAGFYGGVNIGVGWDDDEINRGRLSVPRSPRPGCPPCNGQVAAAPAGSAALRPEGGSRFFGRSSGENAGILGGGQIGVNLQAGMMVFGLEADVQGIDFDKDGREGRLGDRNGYAVAREVRTVFAGRGVVPPVNAGGTGPGAANVAFFNNGRLHNQQGIDLFGTVRGRLGVAFDRLLVYATGGLAWADGDDTALSGYRTGADVPRRFFVAQPDPVGNLASRAAVRVRAPSRGAEGSDFGWTLGGGVEYALTNSLSAKLEGLYVDLDDDTILTRRAVVGVTNTGAPVTYAGRTLTHYNDFAVVRVGLNYLFGTF